MTAKQLIKELENFPEKEVNFTITLQAYSGAPIITEVYRIEIVKIEKQIELVGVLSYEKL